MLDGQFSTQNGAGSTGRAISVIVAPPGPVTTPENNKWIAAKSVKQEGKRIQITDNKSAIERLVICISELCGTAILVFLGCAGCIDFTRGSDSPSHLQTCLTFGFAVMLAIQCVGHISGSHINPLVTVAAATMGNIALIQIPVYFVGQILGAIGGFALVKLATPPDLLARNGTGPGLCSPQLYEDVTPIQGLLIEFLLGFLLAVFACGVWDARNSSNSDSVPIRFGFTIAVLALAGGPYTGGNFNPARSFGPALLNGDWDNHWIFWVGPLGGGLVGALFYRLLFGQDFSEDEQGYATETVDLNEKA